MAITPIGIIRRSLLLASLAAPVGAAEPAPAPTPPPAQDTERAEARKTEPKLTREQRAADKSVKSKTERDLRERVRDTSDRMPEPRDVLPL